ncbi:hypothetical protein HK100_006534 [Physocladia obscura]|uniref:Uncharacterized protein n=1 Tax=Physocladia obscura TaxID=109957 RepID=A0AAD5X8R5_9FUNG|nr:hypothetical protein HK100_006534 [Physocladia obscura]
MVTEITKEEIKNAVSEFKPVWTVMRAIQKLRSKNTSASALTASASASSLASGGSRSDLLAVGTPVTGSVVSTIENKSGVGGSFSNS